MKAMIKSLFLGGLFVFTFASPVMAAITPAQSAHADAACEGRVLGIPPWYRGLTGPSPDCNIEFANPSDSGALSKFIWKIVLNVIEMAIVATAYVATFFILYGGFLYMTGGALPAQLEKARKTILNAVIGLVICLAAIALTNLVFTII